MKQKEILSAEDYKLKHGEFPSQGRCQECREFCTVHVGLATVLYVSSMVSSNRWGAPQEWNFSHVRNCSDHEPTKKKLKKVRETIPELETLRYSKGVFYIIGDIPVRDWVLGLVPKGDIIRWIQPKFKTPDGTRLGKRKAEREMIPGPVMAIVGYEKGELEIPFEELPVELQIHIVKLKPEYKLKDVRSENRAER